MPITFLEAKARVSPNAPILPGSKEHEDCLKLMRQSGHIFPEDLYADTYVPPPPRKAMNVEDLKLFRERLDLLRPELKGVSKKAWLSVDANRKAYDEHIAANQILPPGALEPIPDHLSWESKVVPHGPQRREGLSKREWVASLIKNNDS